jgi:chitin disaccharide deacetylase
MVPFRFVDGENGQMIKKIRMLALALVPLSAVAQSNSQPKHTSVAERLGYPADSRLLIIHADDFGMMHSVNRAIMEAFEHHWITSASILVPCPWFPEAAIWAKSHPNADLGVHLALNSDWTFYRWGPVSQQGKLSSIVDQQGYLPLTTKYVIEHAEPKDIETETHAQIDKARAAEIRLSHLDAHMDTLVSSPSMFRIYLDLGRTYGLPVLLERHLHFQNPVENPDTIVMDRVLELRRAPAKAEWLQTYEQILHPLPPGIYELIVHLAYNDDEIKAATSDHADWGAEWRQNDLDVVRSGEFHQFLKQEGFVLVSWRDLVKANVR